MELVPIMYRGRLAALATRDRVFLARDLQARPAGDGELRLVLLMCCYARDVLCGQLPGPYELDSALRYARAALIPGELLERVTLDIAHAAAGLGIPAAELEAARREHEHAIRRATQP